MKEDLEPYKKTVRKICPELMVENISLNSTGLLNDVVIVNNDLVFRFVKRGHGYKDPREEASLLRFLTKYITLPIPEPFHDSADALAYPLIAGTTLRRDVLMRLADDEQQAIADQLAGFLKELHGVPVEDIQGFRLPIVHAQRDRDGWINAYDVVQEKVFPLLMPHARDWATEHFESFLADESNFSYELKMIHSDLPSYHIIFDEVRKRLSGIIDFGAAGLGDPAIDLGSVIYYLGESFFERLYDGYPECETRLKRARFYAGEKEIRWLLTGIQKNDLHWFAKHVAAAKDVKYESFRE